MDRRKFPSWMKIDDEKLVRANWKIHIRDVEEESFCPLILTSSLSPLWSIRLVFLFMLTVIKFCEQISRTFALASCRLRCGRASFLITACQRRDFNEDKLWFRDAALFNDYELPTLTPSNVKQSDTTRSNRMTSNKSRQQFVSFAAGNFATLVK